MSSLLEAAPEFLTLTAGAASSVKSFTAYTAKTIRDVILHNLDGSEHCWMTMSKDDPKIEATNLMFKLTAGSTLTLANCRYIHFAVLRFGSADLSIRVSGFGRNAPTEY